MAKELSLSFLQVSRCEKFGYGVMMTQVAATAPGVMALQKSGNELLPYPHVHTPASFSGVCHPHPLPGFVQALITELWAVLECSREDVTVVRPPATPMEPIDRSCLKVPGRAGLIDPMLEARNWQD